MDAVASLDPRDFDLIEGLTARLVAPSNDGLEIVWSAEGVDVARAVVLLRGEDAVWTELTVTDDRWWKKGLGSAVVKDLLKPLRALGVKRYVVEATVAEATDFFLDRGFKREGGLLVGSTAPQGKLAKGRQ